MTNLRTPWELAQKAGEPHSVIRVGNLQTSLKIAKDAWGRSGKCQPVLLSISVSLKQPFDSAANQDAVTQSTVHYGSLSKRVMEICERVDDIDRTPKSTENLILLLVIALTGSDFDGLGVREGDKPLLSMDVMHSLQIKVLLPKASLIGSGVSLTNTVAYFGLGGGPIAIHSIVLALHDLRIPALIGVNSNERLAKQVIVTNVEIEKWFATRDMYNELEEIVVKTVEESSFQTLEALALHLIRRIIKYFIYPLKAATPNVQTIHPRIRVKLEKPTAVIFADAPMIEMLLDSNPSHNGVAEEVFRKVGQAKRPPFPLEGRLDEWIARYDPEAR